MSDIEFKPFPKIPRLKRDICITEKIDGTNASILIGDEDLFKVGSRNRWITPESDNYGFARWAYENRERLVQFLGLGHHFGEWYGAGIQRRYGLAEKRFALFNTKRWASVPKEYLPSGVDVVPILYEGPWTNEAINESCEQLRICGSKIAPGFMEPEGVVVFHKASGQLYKYTLDGDGHKDQKAA